MKPLMESGMLSPEAPATSKPSAQTHWEDLDQPLQHCINTGIAQGNAAAEAEV